MKRWTGLCLLGVVVGLAATGAVAQEAGTQKIIVTDSKKIGVSVTEVKVVAKGLSVKKSLLGKDVYNGNEKIGEIRDLIAAPDTFVSYAIIGIGGFLGIGTHDVAIPVAQFSITPGGRIVLPGASKELLKAMPEFEYAK